ncbi:spindle pole body interacting protein [Moniliophthora roreri]|nr:spindle pole body interacting protein [Moniliophthora roreri]
MVPTSSMKRLSVVLSGLTTNVPDLKMSGAMNPVPVTGCAVWISFETVTVPEPISNKRSHRREVSKIGLVTPAMYAGLCI